MKRNRPTKSELARRYAPAPVKDVEQPAVELPPLNLQHEKFVAHYAVHFNAAWAAREAGFSPDTARQIGYMLLTRVDIQRHVEALRQQLGRLHYDLANQLLAQYNAMRLADITEMFDADGGLKDPDEWPEECKLLVTGIEIEEQMRGEGDGAFLVRTKKVKLESRKAVMDSMMRVLGKFGIDPESQPFGGAGGVQPIVQFNITVGGEPTG